MADFDSKLPIRSLAADNTTEIADSAGTTINPAKEDGNLATLAGGVSSAKYQVNNAQVAGTAVSVNTGNSDAGTQRVVLASDQPAVAENLTEVGGSAIALGQTTMAASLPVTIASNQTDLKVDLDKVAGTTTSVNTGNSDAGTQRVVIASDQPTLSVSFTDTTASTIDYKKATAVAAAASDTHTLSPGSTINVTQVDFSGSGQMKCEIKYGTTGSEVSKWVGFTSKGDLNGSFRLPHPITITNTQSILVILTNTDNQAQDVYSSIIYS